MNAVNKLALIGTAALTITGCALPGRMMTASTLGKGAVEGGFQTGLVYTAGDVQPIPLPELSGHLRVGVTDRFDVGFRAGVRGAELQTRFRLLGENGHGTVLSVAPLYHIALQSEDVFSDLTMHELVLPVLIGFQNGRGDEWVLAPQLGLRAAGGYDELSLEGALSVSRSFRVSNTLRLQPELAFGMPIYGPATESHAVTNRGPSFEFSLGFNFGKRKWDTPYLHRWER